MFETFALECFVTYCNYFVYQEYLRGNVHGYGETKPHVHATRENLDRSINEIAYVTEINDLIDSSFHFFSAQTENGAVQENIFATA